MALDFIVDTYALALLQITPTSNLEETRRNARDVVDSCVERAREKHPDFERFLPGIEFLSTVFFTDHLQMPLEDYIETLYCAVKHADFTRSWRAKLKRPTGVETVN